MTQGVLSLWNRLHLVTRLMLAVACSFAIAVGLALYITAHYAAIDAKQELASEYERELDALGFALTPALLSHDSARIRATLEGFRRSTWVVNVGFRDVSDGAGFSRETPAELTAPAWFARWCGSGLMGGTRPLLVDGVYFGIVSLELSPVPAINQAWDGVRRQLLILGLALTLIFIGVWLVLRNGLKPLQALAKGSQAFSRGNFSTRLRAQGSPELRESIDGFNQMASAVERMVSEIQANNIALASSEEKQRITLQSIGDGVIATDAQGRVAMMNPQAELMTGWSLADAQGQPVARVFHIINEDTRREVESPVDIVLKEGRIVGLANHTLLVARDGKEWPIADSGAPIRLGDDGAMSGVVLVFRDQSEERNHLNALRESEQLYSSLAEASPVGIFRLSLDGQVIYANTQLKRILGLDEAASTDAALLTSLIHPDDQAEAIAHWNEVIACGQSINDQHRMVRTDGAVLWVIASTSICLDGEGRPIGFVGTLVDITNERENARKIEHLSRLYATLSAVNSAIVHSKGSDTLFPEVCRVAHEVGGFAGAWLVVADWDSGRVSLGGAAVKDIERVRAGVESMSLRQGNDSGQTLACWALISGERQVSNDYLGTPLLQHFHEDVKALGGAAVLGVPIRQNGKPVAALVLMSDEKDYFSDDILALADEIGGDISFALDNFERERQRRDAEQRLRDNEERLRLSLGASRQGSYEIDLINGRVFIDAVCAELLGFKAEPREMSHPDYKALWPTVTNAVVQSIAAALSPASPNFTCEDEYTTPGGEKRWLQRCGAVVGWSAKEQPTRIMATIADVSERHALEDHMRMTAMMFDNSKDAIIITDKDAKILAVNRAFSDINGYSSAEAIGRNPSMLKSGRQKREFYSGLWRQVLEQGFWQGEIWNRRKNGDVYPCLATVSVVRRPDGQPTHFLGLATDITKQKEFEERITKLAYRDSLTDLPNRTLLRDRVEQNLASAQRDNHELAMLFLDLDHFKNINDSLGHAVGDQLLMEVGRRMRLAVRERDTVGRLGGDEFLLVLPDTDADAAAHVAQKLLADVAKPLWIDSHTLTVTPSIGISMFPKDGRSFDELMKSADTAMYKAKEIGRNAYYFASSEMNQAVFQRLVLESSLRRAISGNEFVLFYQPQYAMGSRHLVGVEALIRWNQPELGFVSPAQFIPVAEESGLIEPIGTWVLGEACRQAKAWQEQGLPRLRVGVNFSTRQFAARNLLQVVDQALEHSGLDGDCLEVEITESLLAGDMDYILDVLRAFKARGIHISIDDFGTGYSSLNYLKRFPIDRLKIDQSFVRDLVTDADDRAIASAVVMLGHSLGMKVIAEGVETIEQFEILQEMKCDEVQGYYLARPMAAGALAELLGKTEP